MKVEIVNYRTGKTETIEIDQDIKTFVYKRSYYSSLSEQKAIYGWDECKKSGQKKKAVPF
jgi:hypothetical protein